MGRKPRQETVYSPDYADDAPEQEPGVAVEEAPVNASAPITADTPVFDDEAAESRRQAEEIRRKRTRPFGALNQKLALPERPYYKRHWFNDTPGRVDMAKQAGWTHVKEGDEPIKRVVGSGRDGGALHAFAMEIPREIFEEEEAARHALAQAKVDDIRKNPFRAKPGTAERSDAGKFYSPEDEPLSVKGAGS